MPLEDVTAAFSASLQGLSDQVADPERLEEKLPELAAIADDVVDVFKDGWQWADLISLGELVRPIMVLASEIEAYTGEQKRQFVVDAVWLIYRSIDGGPSGNENRINIPLVFGSIETKIEKKIVAFVTDFAIGSLFNVLREKGEV